MMVFDPTEFDRLSFGLEDYLKEIVEMKQQIREREHRPQCKYFPKGQCHRGDDCPYRHGRSDKSVVCKHWLRGLCKKDEQCEFLHEYDMSKMPPCHFFATYGACSNEECPFLHLTAGDRVKDCPWYNRGFCKHGPKCRNRHVRNEPCPDYMAGFCLKGKDCKFGHPKHEIPAEHQNSSGNQQDADQFESRNPKRQAMGRQFGREDSQSHGDGENRRRPLSEVTCFKCGEMGHYATVCTNPRRPPPPGGYMVGGRPQGNRSHNPSMQPPPHHSRAQSPNQRPSHPYSDLPNSFK